MLKRFDALEENVKDNKDNILEIEKSLNFQGNRMDDIEKDNTEINRLQALHEEEIVKMTEKLNELESKANKLERYTRSFNVRFLNIEETDKEDCRAKAGKLIEEHLQIPASSIEHAHRAVHKPSSGPRHLIAWFPDRDVRKQLFVLARSEPRPPFRVIDDLTEIDLKEKRRVAPAMDLLYRQGKKNLASKLAACSLVANRLKKN